jgi:hypothetical protein
MVAVDTKLIQGFFASLLAVFFYGFSFWRISRNHRGNKVIECGSIAIMVLLAMAFYSKFAPLPDWLLGCLLLLLFLLCLCTLFFLAQEGYRALRSRMSK